MMTDEDTKLIWVWCGFKQTDVPIDIADWHKRTDIYKWFEPNASGVSPMLNSLPPIDLKNLFKYAVPKLFELGLDYKLFSDDGYHFCDITKYVNGKDKRVSFSVGCLESEEAFGQALLKLIKELER